MLKDLICFYVMGMSIAALVSGAASGKVTNLTGQVDGTARPGLFKLTICIWIAALLTAAYVWWVY